jgi:hypothetical protein
MALPEFGISEFDTLKIMVLGFRRLLSRRKEI